MLNSIRVPTRISCFEETRTPHRFIFTTQPSPVQEGALPRVRKVTGSSSGKRILDRRSTENVAEGSIGFTIFYRDRGHHKGVARFSEQVVRQAMKPRWRPLSFSPRGYEFSGPASSLIMKGFHFRTMKSEVGH